MKMTTHLYSCSIALALLGAAGCGGKAPPAPELPDHIKLMLAPGTTIVARGNPPLNYKTQRPGTITIVDLTMKNMQGFAAVPQAGSVVTLDPKEAGVLVRNPKTPHRREVLYGQIDPEHEYAIYFSPNGLPSQPR